MKSVFFALVLSVLLSQCSVSAAPTGNPLGHGCLWVSQIESIFLHEANKEKDPQAATCMTREGRSMLLNEFGCVKDMPKMQLMSVQCTKCVKKENCYSYVRKCRMPRF